MGNVYEEYVGLLGKGFQCECGKYHEVPVRQVLIEKGALGRTAMVLQQLGHNRRLHLAADSNTWDAAGKDVEESLTRSGFEVSVTRFEDKELVADERALNRLIGEMADEMECLVAVGSGTINDISRYAAFKRGKPYIIIATAPSMDGYASSVSPLIIGGFKNTYNAVAPEAIIGDLEVICGAPEHMVGAGFGDLLGKVICQNDWKLGQLLNGEYYCEYVSKLIYRAVEVCMSNIEGLRKREPDAIEALMHGLVLSGIGMLMVGNSRPASGCEHHLSHFWEMRFLLEGRETALHGQKVGVSSVLMAGIYNRLAGMEKRQIREYIDNRRIETTEARMQKIRQSFGILAEVVLRENAGTEAESRDVERIYYRWENVKTVLQKVPEAGEIHNMLKATGAPATPESLGINRALTAEGLQNCMYVRNRYSILRMADELGILERAIDDLT